MVIKLVYLASLITRYHEGQFKNYPVHNFVDVIYLITENAILCYQKHVWTVELMKD
jgi:hypothetical protein